MSLFGKKLDVVSARAAGNGTLSYFGGAAGAGLAYAFLGRDLMSIGIGAVAGYFAYPMVQQKVSEFSLPYPAYILPAASGAAIAYGLYGQDYTMIAGGAAAGAGAGYLLL